MQRNTLVRGLDRSVVCVYQLQVKVFQFHPQIKLKVLALGSAARLQHKYSATRYLFRG